jgi:hypothetical protein
MEDTAALVPIQLLASEWGCTAEQLIGELGAHRVITDALDVRFVSVTDARELLDQRKASAAQRQQDQAAWRAALDAQGQPVRARVLALQQQQRALRHSGQVDAGADAYSVMTYGANEERLSPASRRMDAYLRGVSEGYSFGGQPQREH